MGFPRSRQPAPETQELSTCSARSAARTNDVDGDEHRRILATGEETPNANRKRHHPPDEFALHNDGRQCHAERDDEGPDQMP